MAPKMNKHIEWVGWKVSELFSLHEKLPFPLNKIYFFIVRWSVLVFMLLVYLPALAIKAGYDNGKRTAAKVMEGEKKEGAGSIEQTE